MAFVALRRIGWWFSCGQLFFDHDRRPLFRASDFTSPRTGTLVDGMLRPMVKTTVFTLQNVPEDNLGRSIVRASPHAAPSCANIRACLGSLPECKTEFFDLRDVLPVELRDEADEAAIGIIRGAPDALWGAGTLQAMEREFDAQADALNKHEWSRRHVRDATHPKGEHDGVVRLRLRWHMYIGDRAKTADYPGDQATVVAFDQMPLAKRWREFVTKTLREFVTKTLRGNGVACPDLTSCTNINYVDGRNGTGIGWHGDAERTIIVTLRLHAGSVASPLKFNWMRHGCPVGSPVALTLDHGDAYIMSKKATGNDFRDTSVLTLQHASGGPGCAPAKLDALGRRAKRPLS